MAPWYCRAGAGAIAGLSVVLQTVLASPATPVHLLLVVADDLGWADVGGLTVILSPAGCAAAG